MLKILINFLIILFLACCLGTGTSGAEENILPSPINNFKDSGTFKLYVNDSQLGTINFSLDEKGNYERKFILSMSGQSVEFAFSIHPDANGYWENMLITVPTQTIPVVRKGAKAEYTAKEQTYSTALSQGHIIYDNYGLVFESIMLKQYDLEKKGQQEFPRFFVPSSCDKVKVEYKGEEIREIKGESRRFLRFDLDFLGILCQVWAGEDYKIYFMNVPVQYAAFIREGYEELRSAGAEDPLLSKPNFQPYKETIMMPMRDGVELATDMYFPGSKQTQAPVILIRTPYKKEMMELDGNFFAQRGYITAIQDCRGCFASGGSWEPFVNEPKDGYDSVEWLAARPWCTGKVGMIGGSYVGWVQLWAAAQKPPHLTTIIPNVAPPDPFFNIPYEYGTFFILGSAWWAEIVETEASGDLTGRTMEKINERKFEKVLKKLPVIDLDKEIFGKENPYWRKWIKNNTNNDYWAQASFLDKLKELDLPVFLQSGWFDGDGIGSKLNYLELKKSKNKYIKLIVGPWGHTSQSSSRLGEYDFGKEAAIDLRTLYLRWFDYWLKGIENKITTEPLVQLFVMFSNKWLEAATYPLPQTKFTPYYFSSNQAANTSKGDGKLLTTVPTGGKQYDTYVYDPGDPTPYPSFYSKSEEQEEKDKTRVLDRAAEIEKYKTYHQRVTDERRDILVFETPPLEEPLTIAGPVSAQLYAATSAVDTDWFVCLMDVDDKGEIFELARGTIRARFKDSTRQPVLLEKNKIYPYTIDLWHTGITFQKGHKIRVEVMSALFPLFSRNLNTGGHNEMETKYIKAKQRIYHSSEYPSHILLPVIE